jgi:hypothetical protein
MFNSHLEKHQLIEFIKNYKQSPGNEITVRLLFDAWLVTEETIDMIVSDPDMLRINNEAEVENILDDFDDFKHKM